MENEKNFGKIINQKEDIREEDFTKNINDIKQAYLNFLDKNLKPNDPLRDKILEYFIQRKDTDSEYNFILKKLNQEERDSFAVNLNSELESDPGFFISKMERFFSVQSIYEKEKNLNQNPRIATKEEYDLGAYGEFFEPQVRDAVFSLNSKGYKTFQSGYSESNSKKQFIDFYNKNIVIPESLKNELIKKGINIEIENFDDRTTLSLAPIKNSNIIRQDEWTEIWNLVSNYMPAADSEMVKDPGETILHKNFRNTQDLLSKINK